MRTLRSLTVVILSAAILLPAAACAGEAEDISVVSSATSAAVSSDTSPIEMPTPMPSPTSVPVDLGYVRMLNDVTEDMMDPECWISQGVANGFDMDEVIMTEDEINAFNNENHVMFKLADGTELFRMVDIVDTFDGNKLRQLLRENRGHIPDDPSQYYLNGTATTRSYWQGLAALDNIDGVPDTIQARFGYTVKRATLRLFPTEDQVYESKSDRYFDYILFSECMPYTPAIILHESTDGNYYYAVFDSFAAWVRKDVIALCPDRADWLARQDMDQCLTVTAREIRLGNDPHSPATSNLVLPMGTHMELVPASEAPASIGQRTSFGDYVVKVPTRGSDGMIKDEYVLIPVSDDVVVGMLPYTSANVLRETFKLLGDRYGWGGDLQANDCSGIVREIYATFGFLVPRVLQTEVTGIHKVDLSNMSNSEKLSVLAGLTPGSPLSMPGHMVIYIGTVNGRPYVISAVGTFVQPEPGSNDVLHPRSVVLSSLYVRTRSMKTWLTAIRTALEFKVE